MSKIINSNNKKLIGNLESFEKWLIARGAEILPTTNEYELLRFKGKEVGILYKTGRVSGAYAQDAINCFSRGRSWSGRPVNTGRKKTYISQKKAILKRDGDCCFYCMEKLNDDITLEHLIPITQGGKNILSNMVLCHEKCNQLMGDKPLVKKINYS